MASTDTPDWALDIVEDFVKKLHFQETGAWLLDEPFQLVARTAGGILEELAPGAFVIAPEEMGLTGVAYKLSQEDLGDLGRIEICQFADTRSSELTVVKPSRPARRDRTPEEIAALEAISDPEARHRAMLDLEKQITEESEELYDRRLDRHRELVQLLFELMGETGVLGSLKPYSNKVPPETDQEETGHPSAYEPYVFRQKGDFWEIAFESESTYLKDLKGLHYIACLLCHPHREFHVLELVACVEKHQADPAAASYGRMNKKQLAEDGLYLRLGASPDNVADRQAIEECVAKKIEIDEEIEKYTVTGDYEKVAELQDEMEEIDAYLKRATGLHGRQRKHRDEAEKARVNIQKLISSALDRIAERNATAYLHLKDAIETGHYCQYNPDRDQEVNWITE